MAKYLVSYDLDEPGPQDYDRIIDAIQAVGGIEVLRSQWVIVSDMTSVELLDYLWLFVDTETDRMIVCELGSNWAAKRAIVKISSL
jgi:hypothetical protein